MFFLHNRGSANALYHFALSTAFSLVPMVAGTQALKFVWRSSAVTQAAVITGILFVFIVSFEETKFVRDTGEAVSEDSEKDSVRGLVQAHPGSVRPRKPFPRYLRLQLFTPTSESLGRLFIQPIHSWWLPHVIFTSLVFGTGLMW